MRALCLAKGVSNTVQEPVTFIDIHSSLIRISSRAACAFSGTDGFFGSSGYSSRRRANEAGSGEEPSCGLPTPDCCAAKSETIIIGQPRADGQPFCTGATALSRDDSWYGEFSEDIYASFVFKVSRMNDVELSEICRSDPTPCTWTVEPAHGIGASVVVPDGYEYTGHQAEANPFGVNYEAHYAGNGGSPWALYDGGLMMTANIGPDLTYRMFMFNDDAKLEAAKLDSNNAGLPYAHPFPGANGCNAEVVYELKPRTGGGLSAHASIEQLFLSVFKTVKWYGTDDEVVVLASRSAYKASARHSVPAQAGCDDGDVEILRFSRSFICKATGETVTASIDGPEGATLGTASSPQTFASVYPQLMDLPNDGANGDAQYSIGFSLSLSAADAPESCESMYWDPYLQTPLGGGAPSYEMTYTLTLAGDLSSFDAELRSSIASAIAQAAGVDVSAVSVSVEAASVRLTIVIATTDTSAITALTDELSTAESANAFFAAAGVSVTVESVDAAPTPTSTTTSDDTLPPWLWPLVGGLGGGLVVFGGFAYLSRPRSSGKITASKDSVPA